MKKIKVALIGCGNIGYQYEKLNNKWISTHIGAFNSLDNAEIIAVCDLDVNKAKECAEKHKINCFYQDHRQMLMNESPEIIIIAVPTKEHYYVLKDIVSISKSVRGILCEKPLATSLSQGQEMLELCRKENILLQVNFIRRFDPLYIYIKENLNKLIGDPQKAVLCYSSGVANAGSHAFDLARYYFEDPLWIRGNFENFISNDEANVSGEIMFKNNILVSYLSFNSKYFPIFEFCIYGSKGKIEFAGKPFRDELLMLSTIEESQDFSNMFRLSYNHKELIPKDILRDYMENSAKGIISAIHGGELICSGEDGLKALEMVLAAIYSAQKGGVRINFPFSDEKLTIYCKGDKCE